MEVIACFMNERGEVEGNGLLPRQESKGVKEANTSEAFTLCCPLYV